MALGSSVGVRDPGALGDVLVGTATADFSRPSDGSAEFTVEVPHEDEWSLWARQRYPSGTDQSFAFVAPGEGDAPGDPLVLGNCGRNEARWHWARGTPPVTPWSRATAAGTRPNGTGRVAAAARPRSLPATASPCVCGKGPSASASSRASAVPTRRRAPGSTSWCRWTTRRHCPATSWCGRPTRGLGAPAGSMVRGRLPGG